MNHLQNATAAALIVGYFAAHAAALLVHLHAPDWFQGLVTTVLTVLAGVLPTVVWNPGDNWKVYLVNVVAAMATAFFAYKTKMPAQVQLKVQSGLGKNLSGIRARNVVAPPKVVAA
jgi:ABC-type phosphate transport system permease subunit